MCVDAGYSRGHCGRQLLGPSAQQGTQLLAMVALTQLCMRTHAAARRPPREQQPGAHKPLLSSQGGSPWVSRYLGWLLCLPQ